MKLVSAISLYCREDITSPHLCLLIECVQVEGDIEMMSDIAHAVNGIPALAWLD